uniref:Uncharacterized protein n=1 Tax=Biomphalaria glabrata TaxID=6526 RepID=A0A2C9KKK5_BIOGL
MDSCINDDRQFGDHETQESEVEADLYRHFVSCKKNPDHREFIPIDKFTLKDLPESHQDIDLYEYIKATADLTVRVNVEKISPNRPQFWPETSRPYPYYSMYGSSKTRTGSGRVWFVTKFHNGERKDGYFTGHTEYTKCWCLNCHNSKTPSHLWWEFNVDTATHVVFDNFEANNTSLRFFYNREENPVVSVKKIALDYKNIEHDWCRLKCVTCDEMLGNKLMQIEKLYKQVCEKVRDKNINSRDNYKLNFIVSHPHGCAKHISIGQWKDKEKIGYRTMFTYTTSTCPGSSGAFVYCLGYNERWGWADLFHTGTLQSGLNHSGFGFVL